MFVCLSPSDDVVVQVILIEVVQRKITFWVWCSGKVVVSGKEKTKKKLAVALSLGFKKREGIKV